MAPPRRARARSSTTSTAPSLMVSHDRHLLDECVGDDRRARPRARSASGRAPTPPTRSPASSSSSASSSSGSRSRRRSRASRRRSAASATGRTSRVNERAAKQARVKQMQIDKMEKVERPVLERRKMALALRSAARGGQRVLALEGVDVAFGEDPVLLDVELVDHARRARRRGRPQRRRQDRARCACWPASWSRRDGERWVGAGHRGRLPLAGRRRAAARPAGDRRAARRPLDGRGGRGAAADARSCSTTSSSGARSRRSRGGERTRLAFLVPDAGRARTASCSTSRPTTSTSTRSRCSRTRSSATTAR